MNKTHDFPNNMPILDGLIEAWHGNWLKNCFAHSPTPSPIPRWKNLEIFAVTGVQWASSGLWELRKKGSKVFADASVSLKFLTIKCICKHTYVSYVHMYVYTHIRVYIISVCLHMSMYVYLCMHNI